MADSEPGTTTLRMVPQGNIEWAVVTEGSDPIVIADRGAEGGDVARRLAETLAEDDPRHTYRVVWRITTTPWRRV